MERSVPETRVEDVRLSDPISLIGELSKKIKDTTSHYFPKNDIPKGEKLVLQCLVKQNGVTQLEIVRFTGFKPPTISIMIQKMQTEGLVTRMPDEYDLRAMRVYITDLGLEEYNKSVKIVKTVESKLLYNISDDEKKTLVDILNKIKQNLKEFE